MDKKLQDKICPYCKTPFQEDDAVVICSICEMPHHLSCWQENNGCTTFGCTGVINEMIGSISDGKNPSPVPPVITYQPRTGARPEETLRTDAPMKRFEALYEAEPNTIQENIPVLLEKVLLLVDHQTENLMARCVFRCLTDKPITAMLVDVSCVDVWGNSTGKVEGFQFLDLKTKKDSSFGQTSPISIPNPLTRSIEVVIRKVLYSDRTMVDAAPAISILPSQEPLASFFGDTELTEEYIRETHENARYVTTNGKDYWRCACGSINSQSEENCYRCGSNKEHLQGLLNVELITKNLEDLKEQKRIKAEREQAEREEQLRQIEERLRLEQEEKERQEKEAAEALRLKKEKRNKTVRRTILIVFGVLLLGFLVYATIWHVIPYVRYLKANKALEAQSFDEAYNMFSDLGDFSDSPERAIDTLYQKGVFLMNNGTYLDAAAEFDRVPDYQDSAEKAVYCRNEAAYLDAKALYDSGEYQKAAEAFRALGDYADSKEQVPNAEYHYALGVLESGEYETAYDLFVLLKDYEDSEEMAKESHYRLANQLLEEGKYEEAYGFFTGLKAYKESSTLALESRYRLAMQLFDEKKYQEAHDYFIKLSYKDSAKMAQESEYLYGMERLEAHDYENAVKAFQNITGYKDVPDHLAVAKYNLALELTDKKQWEKASKYFKELGDYEDSAARYKETYYQYGLALLNEKKQLAISVFTSLENYKDSPAKLNEAKYIYVSTHKNNTDKTTYEYLKTLRAIGYKDSNTIYNSLYAWKVTLVMNDSETNETTNKATVSRYGRFYCHVKLTGGPPDGSVELKYAMGFPDGQWLYGSWDWAWYSGDTSWCNGYYNNPSAASATGIFRVRIYIKSTGEFLGEATVRIN